MQRWGQNLSRTSEIFGRVAKELKAVELVWDDKLFPPGSLCSEGRSAGYPTKKAFDAIFTKQLQVVGEQARANEGERSDKPNFVNLLKNAGHKAQMPVADDAALVQNRMDRIACALSLLYSAMLLRLRPLSEAKRLNARMGGSRRAEEGGGGARKRQQIVPSARKAEHGKSVHISGEELAAIEALIRVLLDVLRRTQEGRDDVLLTLGDKFRLCEICFDSAGSSVSDGAGQRIQRSSTMVRSFCGHVMCVGCYGQWMMQSAELQRCPFGRCRDFQAVEVGTHIAFLGSDAPKLLPPITRVSQEDAERERLAASGDLKTDMRLWNQDLFAARGAALQALADGDMGRLGEVQLQLAELQLRAQERMGSTVLDAVAQSHAAWVRWVRKERQEAIEALRIAVNKFEQAAKSPSAGETARRYLGSALCTLGVMQLRMGCALLPDDLLEGAPAELRVECLGALKEAHADFERSRVAMEKYGLREPKGDALGHLAVWSYAFGTAFGTAGLAEADALLREACKAYREQLACYEGVGVPKFIEDALRLNVGLLHAKRGEVAEARAALLLDQHAQGNVFLPLEPMLAAPPPPRPAAAFAVQQGTPQQILAAHFVQAMEDLLGQVCEVWE